MTTTNNYQKTYMQIQKENISEKAHTNIQLLLTLAITIMLTADIAGMIFTALTR